MVLYGWLGNIILIKTQKNKFRMRSKDNPKISGQIIEGRTPSSKIAEDS